MIACISFYVDSTTVSTIIVGFLVFMATILAAWLAARSVLLSSRQNNITNARLKWLADFKALISSYLSNCVSAHLLQKELVNVTKMVDEFENRAKEKGESFNTQEFVKYVLVKKENALPAVSLIDSQYHLIRLNLNPRESGIEHLLRLKLIDLNRGIQNFTQEGSPYNFNDDINDIVEICNHFFKVEWEKAKRGDVKAFNEAQEKDFEVKFLKKYKINEQAK